MVYGDTINKYSEAETWLSNPYTNGWITIQNIKIFVAVVLT